MSLKDFLVETFLWDDEDHFRKAVSNGEVALVEHYLKTKKGVDLETRYSDGFTPLMSAIFYGHLGVAQCLLDHGAKVDARSNDGRTALHCAVRARNIAAVQLLVSYGAKTTLSDEDGITPHLYAAITGAEDIFRSLGAIRGDQQYLRLLLAAATGKRQDLERVLGEGTDPNTRDATGSTALIAASYNSQVEAATVLLRHGADPNATTRKGGKTALMFAAVRGNSSLVQLLLSNGAMPGVRDKKGRSARDYAEEEEHIEVASLLDAAIGDSSR
jgi:ankyrin repeat protein